MPKWQVTQIVDGDVTQHTPSECGKNGTNLWLRLAKRECNERNEQQEERGVAERPRTADKSEIGPTPTGQKHQTVVERLVDEIGQQCTNDQPAHFQFWPDHPYQARSDDGMT